MADDLVHKAAQRICCVQCRNPEKCFASIFHEQARSIVNMAFDEAAQLVDDRLEIIPLRMNNLYDLGYNLGLDDAAEMIRAMKDK